MRFTVLIALFVMPLCLYGQRMNGDSLLIAKQVRSLESKELSKRKVHMRKSYNPVKMLLYLTMYGYQSVLSEQISAGCEFDRSCSSFSLAAIQELGLIRGICISADRLTRCNGQAQSESFGYLINHANGKTIDEPFMYHFKD